MGHRQNGNIHPTRVHISATAPQHPGRLPATRGRYHLPMTPTPLQLLALLDAAGRLVPAGPVDIIAREEAGELVVDVHGPAGRVMRLHVGRWVRAAG